MAQVSTPGSKTATPSKAKSKPNGRTRSARPAKSAGTTPAEASSPAKPVMATKPKPKAGNGASGARARTPRATPQPTSAASVPTSGARPSWPSPLSQPWPAPSEWPVNGFFKDAVEYWTDAAERSVLFWDVMRRRGNQAIDHFKAGKPPLLDFDYEMVLDGRDLPRPCNYVLVRIQPDPGVKIDPEKRPFVVVDPRAGHGPGIGGFKKDSQIGVAMRAGHPAYFIGFRPEPEPGQTLADVRDAQAAFIEKVDALHPKADGKPCVIGNCQAGWAITLLSASRPEVTGPIVLNGAPLSYWAGAPGKNPMRLLGGLLGGTWLASLCGDLGNGIFDGAYLVQNFENLNPANTLWSKQYNLYSKVDSEAQRFLDFEKWWHGFFFMTTDEIEFITNELFIGNRLQQGKISLDEGHPIDLKDIREPIVIFCSDADNITPPEQALSWILDVYGRDEEIQIFGQTIVVMLHKDIGHLGIFVSGRVAKREHTGIINTLDMIDVLPPGLYEMVIEDRNPDDPPDVGDPDRYHVRFEDRSLDDLRALVGNQEDQPDFRAVADMSQRNLQAYKSFVRPVVRAMVTEESATVNMFSQPNRAQHFVLSDVNPFMMPIRLAAPYVREHRHAVSKDNSLLAMERSMSQGIVDALNTYRDTRDSFVEAWFDAVFGSNGFGAYYQPLDSAPKMDPVREKLLDMEVRDILADAKEGGFDAAVVRILVGLFHYVDRTVDRRGYLELHRIAKEHAKLSTLSLAEIRELARRQSYIVQLDRDLAIETLKDLLPTKEDRRDCIDLVTHTLSTGGRLTEQMKQVLKDLSTRLGI